MDDRPAFSHAMESVVPASPVAKADQALAESEARYRVLAESSPYSIHVLLDGRYVYVNPATLRTLKFDRPEELLGTSLRDRILPEDWPVVAARIQRAAKGETNPPIELRYLRKDGTYSVMESISLPIRLLGRRAVLVQAVDITPRKLAEEVLRTSEARCRILLEAVAATRAVPWSFHPGTGLFHLASTPGLGLSLDQVNNIQALRKILPPCGRDDFARAERNAREGEPSVFEANLSRPGLDPLPTRWILVRRGDVLYGVIQDVSAEHDLHAQLLQAQKLQSLGTLVSGISHDFNNLLMGVEIEADLLIASPNLTPREAREVRIIQEAVGRGRKLIRQLLEFARKRAHARVKACLNDPVAEALDLVIPRLKQGVALQMELDPRLPRTFMDVDQMHQVAMNLLLNAQDAVGEGGLIRVRTGSVNLPEDQVPRKPGGLHVFLEVTDDGPGIDPRHLDRIFEPFFTTKAPGLGTGLGLAVIHGILESHGGFIRCRSQPKEGAAFTAYLPLVEGRDATDGPRKRVAFGGTWPSPEGLARLLTDLEGAGFQALAVPRLEDLLQLHQAALFSALVLKVLDGNDPDLAILVEIQNLLPDLPLLVACPQEGSPGGLALQGRRSKILPWPLVSSEVLDALEEEAGTPEPAPPIQPPWPES